MITGAHVLLYSADADADRAFIRDVLQFRAVDAGRGWLIFGLPPAEVAVHPADPGSSLASELRASLYLMCDDVRWKSGRSPALPWSRSAGDCARRFSYRAAANSASINRPIPRRFADGPPTARKV